MRKNTQTALAIAGVASICILGGIFTTFTGDITSQQSSSLASTTQASPESTTEPIRKPEPRVETKTETVTTPIPFETQYTNDDSLPQGQTKIITEGADGIETTTYEVTYVDGVENERKIVSVETTKSPITRVIANGTYVAPQPQAQANQNCNIKGNISAKTGEKIYHLPGQSHYNSTIIDTSAGERWFCSEAEAQAAGWRKSKN